MGEITMDDQEENCSINLEEHVWQVTSRAMISSGDTTVTSSPEEPFVHFPAPDTTAAILMDVETELLITEMEKTVLKLVGEVLDETREVKLQTLLFRFPLTNNTYENYSTIHNSEKVGIWGFNLKLML